MRKFLAIVCLSLCMTFGIGSSAFAADAKIEHNDGPTGFVIEKKATVATDLTVTTITINQASYDVGICDMAHYAYGVTSVIGSETIITTGSTLGSVAGNKYSFTQYANLTINRKPIYHSQHSSCIYRGRLWHYRKH